MGMTINKVEKILENYYDTFCGYSDNGLCGAIYTAIKIMRKYQKIKEIMSELNGDFYGSYLKDRQVLEKIYEVVEDDRN